MELQVNSSLEVKLVCQRWNTPSLKVTWHQTRMNIKNLSS